MNFTTASGIVVNAILMENITLPANDPRIVNILYHHGSGYNLAVNYR